MNLSTKTKSELIELVKDQEERIHQLEQDVDYWQKEFNDMEEEKDELDEQLAKLEEHQDIKNLEWFIWKLKLENLYTPELEKFIENYMKFYNN